MLSFSGVKDKLFYGWVVVVAALLVFTSICGARLSFGVFFKSLENEFDLSRAATSGVFSTHMLFCCAFAVLGGLALDRYGPRIVIFLMGIFVGISLFLTGQASAPWQLFIYYGLLLAMGTGGGYAMVMSTTARWFEKRRGLALGIVSSGAGLGTLVVAPLGTYLIYTFDWRMAYTVTGLIGGLVMVSFSRLIRKDPSEIGILPYGATAVSSEMRIQGKADNTQPVSFSLKQAFRIRSFWFVGAIWLLWSSCLHLILTHIVPHAIDVGISPTEAALVLSLAGGISIPARLIMGTVSDRIGRKVSAIICALLQAGAMLWLIWAQDLWMFYLFAVIYGFGYGGIDPPLAALISEIFGLRSLGAIMGALVVGWGIGAAIGPAIGGLIFDASQSYFAAFLIGVFVMLAAALFVALTKQEKNTNI